MHKRTGVFTHYLLNAQNGHQYFGIVVLLSFVWGNFICKVLILVQRLFENSFEVSRFFFLKIC